MPQPRPIPGNDLGRLIDAAMEERGRRQGGTVLYRDIAEAAGLDLSHITKIVKGTRQPSRDAVLSLARALAPELDRDAALVAAGYMPENPSFVSLVRRLAAAGADRWAAIEESLGGLVVAPTEQQPQEKAGGSRGDKQTDQQSTARPVKRRTGGA